MSTPDKVLFETKEEYKSYYVEKYCKNGITTHDGIKVRFSINRFEHAFFERSKSDPKKPKDIFSVFRAERIDWIEEALTNKSCLHYQGFHKYKRECSSERRVTILNDEYIVIVNLYLNKSNELCGEFNTAYSPSRTTIEKIKNNPLWTEYKKPLIHNWLSGKASINSLP